MPTYTDDLVISVSKSASATSAAVQGESSANEGVRGTSHDAHGGVVGINDYAPPGPAGAGGNGGWFESAQGEGVRGWSKNAQHGGVVGVNTAGGIGVYGQSDTGTCLQGGNKDTPGVGVFGESKSADGIQGYSHSAGKAGVVGVNDDQVGNGVYGHAAKGHGVYGVSAAADHAGLAGLNQGAGVGVYAWSRKLDASQQEIPGQGYEAIHADTSSDLTACVAAYNRGHGPALYGAGLVSAVLQGEVKVTRWTDPNDKTKTAAGNITVEGDIFMPNANDCAEEFDLDVNVDAEPGMVLVITDGNRLRPCREAYDRCVAGVVSGAGDYRPGLILGRGSERRLGTAPVALVGRVFCLVDARNAPIAVGDLLTSSPTPGHAMKAADPARAFGAVIGKALKGQSSGLGLIPILVALQ